MNTVQEYIKSKSEETYKIWPNKFRDRDEWLPEDIKRLERIAFTAGAEMMLKHMEGFAETMALSQWWFSRDTGKWYGSNESHGEIKSTTELLEEYFKTLEP